jgi:hypothetical protein
MSHLPFSIEWNSKCAVQYNPVRTVPWAAVAAIGATAYDHVGQGRGLPSLIAFFSICRNSVVS